MSFVIASCYALFRKLRDATQVGSSSGIGVRFTLVVLI
jgi:hypothetical protein